MFVLVAVNAGQRLVLGLAGAQQFHGLLVAGAAILVGNVLAVGYVLRLVRLVAFFAVILRLFGEVRFVALGASRNLAVNVVAG